MKKRICRLYYKFDREVAPEWQLVTVIQTECTFLLCCVLGIEEIVHLFFGAEAITPDGWASAFWLWFLLLVSLRSQPGKQSQILERDTNRPHAQCIVALFFIELSFLQAFPLSCPNDSFPVFLASVDFLSNI